MKNQLIVDVEQFLICRRFEEYNYISHDATVWTQAEDVRRRNHDISWTVACLQVQLLGSWDRHLSLLYPNKRSQTHTRTRTFVDMSNINEGMYIFNLFRRTETAFNPSRFFFTAGEANTAPGRWKHLSATMSAEARPASLRSLLISFLCQRYSPCTPGGLLFLLTTNCRYSLADNTFCLPCG